MCSLTHSAGVAVIYKSFIKDRLDDVAKGVVHDSVSKRRGLYYSPLWVAHHKFSVCSVAISLSHQSGLQLQQIPLQIVGKL